MFDNYETSIYTVRSGYSLQVFERVLYKYILRLAFSLHNSITAMHFELY